MSKSPYTPEIASKVVNMVEQGIPAAEIAENIGFPVKSVIAWLSRKGLYVKPAKTQTKPKGPSKKEVIADMRNQLESFQKITGDLPDNFDAALDGLLSANHEALALVKYMVDTLHSEASFYADANDLSEVA